MTVRHDLACTSPRAAAPCQGTCCPTLGRPWQGTRGRGPRGSAHVAVHCQPHAQAHPDTVAQRRVGHGAAGDVAHQVVFRLEDLHGRGCMAGRDVRRGCSSVSLSQQRVPEPERL